MKIESDVIKWDDYDDTAETSWLHKKIIESRDSTPRQVIAKFYERCLKGGDFILTINKNSVYYKKDRVLDADENKPRTFYLYSRYDQFLNKGFIFLSKTDSIKSKIKLADDKKKISKTYEDKNKTHIAKKFLGEIGNYDIVFGNKLWDF